MIITNIHIVKAILDITHADDIVVIAEGVESKAHIDLLLKLGCRYGQGFAFSQALPANKLESWLEQIH